MKKISIVLIFVFLFLFSGCSSAMVRTVVLPEEINESGIETGKVYTFEDLVPQNMTLSKFVGFDRDDNIVGWFTKGDDCCIMLFNVKERVGQQIVNTDENVVSVVISGKGTVLYETSEKNTRCLYLVGDDHKKITRLAVYPAESSCITADLDEDPRVFSVYRTEGRLKLLCVNTETKESAVYELTSAIENYVGSSMSASVKIKDTAVGRGGRVAVMVQVKDRYYMWTGVLSDDGSFTNTIVMECEGADHVFAGDSVFYVNAQGDLMRLDPAKGQQVVVMEDVDEYYISSDESVAVCARNSGNVKRIYVKKTDSSYAVLADIRQGAGSFLLNEKGTLLMIEYYEKSDPAGKYSVMELVR